MEKESKLVLKETGKEVKLGSKLHVNGVRVNLTKTFVKENSSLFEEVDSKQELLAEAKKKFPIGTIYLSPLGNFKRVVVGNSHITSNGDVADGGYIIYNKDKDKWATPILPLFKSVDGVDVYEGDEYWFIQTKIYIDREKGIHSLEPWEIFHSSKGVYTGNTDIKRFSERSEAEAWLEDNKPEKTLADYELPLLTHTTPLYVEMKVKEPKLYWYKVMLLIQEDLGKGEYFVLKCQTVEMYDAKFSGITDIGFKSSEIAWKVIELMGDKLELFK